MNKIEILAPSLSGLEDATYPPHTPVRFYQGDTVYMVHMSDHGLHIDRLSGTTDNGLNVTTSIYKIPRP